MYHRIDDRKETYQCYGWCYNDTTSAENISIEGMLVRTGTTHQQKTDDGEQEYAQLYESGVGSGAEADESDARASYNTMLTGTAEERLVEVSDPAEREKQIRKTYIEEQSIPEKIKSRFSSFKNYLDAEFSDGSAFATFRVF